MKLKQRLILMTITVITSLSVVGCGEEKPNSREQTEASIDTIEKTAKQPEESEESRGEENGLRFSTNDIDGNPYNESIFSDYDLTMVNIFATWCPPCIAEMPELAELHIDKQAEGVNIISFVIDTGIAGAEKKEAIETAKTLRKDSHAQYLMLIPDQGYLEGLLEVEAVPTTIFVDKNGRLVGEEVVGSNDYIGWQKIINERLGML